MIRKLYPYGRKKAFNVTYDDGVLQDVRFVQLLNQYGLKGTFNLNSALMAQGFEWTHESGLVVKRLSPEAAASLYDGHEVASHTLTHPYMHDLSREAVLQELAQDKANLGRLFGREIKGFAVPFDYYSDLIEACVKACGFAYGRISEESHAFTPQTDAYRWRATVFHLCEDLEDVVSRFLATEEELAVLQIVGHAYDLDVEDKWELMEDIFREISRQEDVAPMTTLELVTYLQAMNSAEIKEGFIRNPSPMPLWFEVDGRVCCLKPHGQLMIS